MGLFDIVIVEYPLPDSGASVVKEWQTCAGPSKVQ